MLTKKTIIPIIIGLFMVLGYVIGINYPFVLNKDNINNKIEEYPTFNNTKITENWIDIEKDYFPRNIISSTWVSRIYSFTNDQLALFNNESIQFTFYNNEDIQNIGVLFRLYTGSVILKFINIDNGKSKEKIISIKDDKIFHIPKEIVGSKNDVYNLYIKSIAPISVISYYIYKPY